jgi:transposase
MSDKEWSFFEPFVIEMGPKRGRPPGDHRLVLDGVFWIARTGAPWRDLPEEFGKWGSVYRQFRRWSVAGVWDAMLEALNAIGMAPSSVQMIDSTIVRAHQHASGAKKGLIRRVLGAREVARLPRSICGPTPLACLSLSFCPAERHRITRDMSH